MFEAKMRWTVLLSDTVFVFKLLMSFRNSFYIVVGPFYGIYKRHIAHLLLNVSK